MKSMAGIVGMGSAYILIQENRTLYALSYGRHCYSDEKRMKWDTNWDCREPITKGNKGGEQGEDKSDIPTATRHLYLIRHGQYVMDNDPDRKV